MNYWKHKDVNNYTLHTYNDVATQILHDGADRSGIHNDEAYLWAKVNGIWTPMQQIAEDVEVVKETKDEKYIRLMPNAILDSKGRYWDCSKEIGYLSWHCDEIDTMVYATPYYEGSEGIVVGVLNSDGDEIKSWVEPVEFDTMISLSNALGKVENRIDIREDVRGMFNNLYTVLGNWQEAGLNDVDGYPEYLPSFDEFVNDLELFFSKAGQR